MVDDNGAACRQGDFTLEGRLDLAFNLVAGEQGYRIIIKLEFGQVVRHDLGHELDGTLMNFLVIDKNFTNIATQVVAQGADDNVAFLVDQKWRRAFLAGLGNGIPELNQVVQIPLQLFALATHTGGTNN